MKMGSPIMAPLVHAPLSGPGSPFLPCDRLAVPCAPRWLRWPRTTFAPGLRQQPMLAPCRPIQRQTAQQELVPQGSARAQPLG